MNNAWLMIVGVMVVGSILKYFFANPFIMLIINLAVLAAGYVILRRYPYVDMKRSMTFLGGLTAIVILVEFGVVNGLVANIGMLALLAWMFFGPGRGPGRPSRPRHQWHK
ncbi:MAG: hypothetical protein P4N59_02355 [Negativicutes bacterium]|nr:hypothetical protein [Negativicutes bacterium]